jgi:hypothetical protein
MGCFAQTGALGAICSSTRCGGHQDAGGVHQARDGPLWLPVGHHSHRFGGLAYLLGVPHSSIK